MEETPTSYHSMSRRLVDRSQDPMRASIPTAVATSPFSKKALGTAVGALEPRDRMRLCCYYVQGLTMAETGRVLREHEATVSRKLACARKRIRAQVEQELALAHGLSAAEGDVPCAVETQRQLGSRLRNPSLTTPRVLTARRVPGGQRPARAYLDILAPGGPPRRFEHPGGHPAQHHRPAAPAFHMALHMARSAEETLDGVRGGERSLETLRQTQAEHGQRLVEPFPHARGRTRVVSVQAPRQVLQQTLGRLDGAVRVGAREDPPSPTAAVPQGDAPRCSDPYGPDTAAPARRARMSGSRPCRGPSRHRRSPADSGWCAARGWRD